MRGQSAVAIAADFSNAKLTPVLLRDRDHALSLEQVVAGKHTLPFMVAPGPFLTFGADTATWWMYFDVKNPMSISRTVVLRLNRKNIDEFRLWFQDSTGQTLFGVKQGPVDTMTRVSH